MPADRLLVPDGLTELRDELPTVVNMIARTAWWVHPDTFRALPVWYPETARGRPAYKSSWKDVYEIKNRETAAITSENETNIKAGQAFMRALGTKKTLNWTVCHIWGVDDPKFSKSNRIVRDPRFYSCVGNMVWLPTPLKGFTDSMPEVKRMLRICAFHLYGWACQHPDVDDEAKTIATSEAPGHYPATWPFHGRQQIPIRTAPYSDRVRKAVKKRKADIRRMLVDDSLINYPRDEVRQVLDFWKIDLGR